MDSLGKKILAGGIKILISIPVNVLKVTDKSLCYTFLRKGFYSMDEKPYIGTVKIHA